MQNKKIIQSNYHLNSKNPNQKTHQKLLKKLFYLGSFIILILTISVIYEKDQINQHESQASDLNTQIKNMQTKNDVLHQEIIEKSTNSRLQSIADQNGLSLNNDQIQNIKKR